MANVANKATPATRVRKNAFCEFILLTVIVVSACAVVVVTAILIESAAVTQIKDTRGIRCEVSMRVIRKSLVDCSRPDRRHPDYDENH